jgi:ABC-type polysaccharide/polyol phosphate export permease
LIASHGINWVSIVVFGIISLIVFSLGAAFFRRFRLHLVDYE